MKVIKYASVNGREGGPLYQFVRKLFLNKKKVRPQEETTGAESQDRENGTRRLTTKQLEPGDSRKRNVKMACDICKKSQD